MNSESVAVSSSILGSALAGESALEKENPPASAMEGEGGEVLGDRLSNVSQNANGSQCVPMGVALHQALPTYICDPAYLQCAKKMDGIMSEGHQEAFMSGSVADAKQHVLPLTPAVCEDREMVDEGQNGGRYPQSGLNSRNIPSVHSVPETEVVRCESQHCRHDNTHYSATLGISTLDLPRRTLRQCKQKGGPFTPPGFSFNPSCASTGGLEWRSVDPSEEGEDMGGTSCSPSSLSASLGITSVRASAKAATLRRLRCRNRVRQKYWPVRANHKENWSDTHTHDSSVKSCDYDVKSYGFGSSLLKVAEDNASSKSHCVSHMSLTSTNLTPSQSRRETSGSGSTGDGLASGVAMGNGSVREGAVHQSLWFNSPWGRGSARGALGGGKLSR